MKRHLTVMIGAAAVLSACAQNAQVQSSGEVAPATPANRNYLPAGTTMNVRLNESLGTTSSKEGDRFTATLVDPVVATNGATAVPAVLSNLRRLTFSRRDGDLGPVIDPSLVVPVCGPYRRERSLV